MQLRNDIADTKLVLASVPPELLCAICCARDIYLDAHADNLLEQLDVSQGCGAPSNTRAGTLADNHDTRFATHHVIGDEVQIPKQAASYCISCNF